MKGHGRSYGAISVMNAIPCGIGSTIGIELTTDVEFSDSDTTTITLVDRPDVDTKLVRTCVKRTLESIDQEPIDYSLKVISEIPPSIGLKSSSSVCNATISAVLDALGERMEMLDIIRLGVRCARECNVTVTGSFDDACGCEYGGLVITDNKNDDIINRMRIPEYDVIICLPGSPPKEKIPKEKYTVLSDMFQAMAPSIKSDYLNVLTKNGRYIGRIIGDTSDLAESALKAGALAAGVSGTGPAIAALTEKGKGKEIADRFCSNYILTRTR